MVKINNKQIIKIGIILITFTFLLFNIQFLYTKTVYVAKIISPILIGCILAYSINIPMNFFEKRVFGFIKGDSLFFKKLRRVLSLSLILIIIFSSCIYVTIRLVPQVINIVNISIAKLPNALRSLESILKNYGLDIHTIINMVSPNTAASPNNIQNSLNYVLKILLNGVIHSGSLIGAVFSSVLSTFLTIMFIIYVLMSKESLKELFLKINYSYLNIKYSTKIHSFLKKAHIIFSSFIKGQFIEAIILSLLIFISMSIFKMPYTLLISAIVGIFALLPIIGAWIAAIAGTLLILTVDINSAFGFIILFLIVQAFEGNVIYPKVIGQAIGLPALWILVAVVIGQGLFGVIGTLVLIPLTSLLYTIVNEASAYKLIEKNIDIDLYK